MHPFFPELAHKSDLEKAVKTYRDNAKPSGYAEETCTKGDLVKAIDETEKVFKLMLKEIKELKK